MPIIHTHLNNSGYSSIDKYIIKGYWCACFADLPVPMTAVVIIVFACVMAVTIGLLIWRLKRGQSTGIPAGAKPLMCTQSCPKNKDGKSTARRLSTAGHGYARLK